MKQLTILLLMVFFITVCKKSDDCTPAKYSYSFSENKKIDTIRPGGFFLATRINSGNNIVFSYSFIGESCPGRSDGPGGEYLVFEIPASTTNFNYSSIDIQNIQCYYGYSVGDGSSSDAIKIIQGTIKGNKISANAWSIEVNVSIAGRNTPLSFKKQFNPQ